MADRAVANASSVTILIFGPFAQQTANQGSTGHLPALVTQVTTVTRSSSDFVGQPGRDRAGSALQVVHEQSGRKTSRCRFRRCPSGGTLDSVLDELAASLLGSSAH